VASGHPGGPDPEVEPLQAERSLGELFSQLGEDLSGLISSQMELARAELTAEARQAGKAAGLLGAGGLLGYLALTLLCFAAAWGLSEVVPEGVAFLIVGVVVAIVAAVLVARGRKQMEATRRVAPETVQTLKEDVQWTRRQMT
jgi:hypothetical protein